MRGAGCKTSDSNQQIGDDLALVGNAEQEHEYYMNINAIHFQHTAVSGASENSDEEEQESVMKHLNIVTKDMNINAVVSRGGRESMG